MADQQRALMGVAVAGTSLLGAWRGFRRADTKFRKLRALISLVAAISMTYGVVQSLRGADKTSYS